MARRSVIFIAVMCLTWPALPAGALAKGHGAPPPGNSAVNQYLEVVPTAGGGRPSNSIHHAGPPAPGGSGGSGGSSPLTPATEHAFAQQGADGQAAAALAAGTAAGSPAPAPASPGSGRRGHGARLAAGGKPRTPPGSQPRRDAAGGTGSAPLTTLAKAVTGSSTQGGISPLLPEILIAVAVGGGIIAAVRRRRTT